MNDFIIDSDPPTAPTGFGMIPAWLAWKQPTGNAVLVYLHLALFGRFNTMTGVYEQCRPSKPTLANGGKLKEKTGYPGTGLSVATIERALVELRDLGAATPHVRYDHDGGQAPTEWTLHYNAPGSRPACPDLTGDLISEVGGGPHPRGGGDLTGEVGGTSRVRYNPEPLTHSSGNPEENLSLSSLAPSAPTAERETISDKKKDKDPAVEAAVARMLLLAKEKRGFAPSRCRKEIMTALADWKDVDRVERAWAACMAHPLTTSPARFNRHDEWWTQQDQAGSTAGAPSTSTRPPHCGTCDPQTRQRLNGEGLPYRCPECHPLAGQTPNRRTAVPAQDPRVAALVNAFAS